jgi:hypothetical protein
LPPHEQPTDIVAIVDILRICISMSVEQGSSSTRFATGDDEPPFQSPEGHGLLAAPASRAGADEPVGPGRTDGPDRPRLASKQGRGKMFERTGPITRQPEIVESTPARHDVPMPPGAAG